MLTFEECLAIARAKKRRINSCMEYTNAYVFAWDDGTEQDGGESPIVVMRETGETMNMTAFIWMPKDFVGNRGVD
jgi:hypothetical protein